MFPFYPTQSSKVYSIYFLRVGMGLGWRGNRKAVGQKVRRGYVEEKKLERG